MKNITKLFSVLSCLFLMQSISAQDWANLEYYQKQNAELECKKAGEERVVFMGNSITRGWIRKHPVFFEGKPYVNRGIAGQTTPQMLLRFRQDVIKLNPTVVVILAGINDIAENTGPSSLEMIMNNIKSMTELAKANNIEVILCSVLPTIDFPWKPGLEPADKVIELNKLISAYAKEMHIEYVDYYSAVVSDSKGMKEDLASDGVHPNIAGYSVMEPMIEKVISSILAKTKNTCMPKTGKK